MGKGGGKVPARRRKRIREQQLLEERGSPHKHANRAVAMTAEEMAAKAIVDRVVVIFETDTTLPTFLGERHEHPIEAWLLMDNLGIVVRCVNERVLTLVAQSHDIKAYWQSKIHPVNSYDRPPTTKPNQVWRQINLRREEVIGRKGLGRHPELAGRSKFPSVE
jgi:hypothetical protein